MKDRFCYFQQFHSAIIFSRHNIITTQIKNKLVKICPVTGDDIPAIFQIYQHCEDFLALGPVPKASMEMVRKDLEISKAEGGAFCGIYTEDEIMIGVVDFVPNNFQGNPHTAFFSLLLIDSAFRGQGIGKSIVEAVENEIRKDKAVKTILTGVQVNNPQAVKFWQWLSHRQRTPINA